MPNFRSAMEVAQQRKASGGFEFGGMTDDEKRTLCLSLLAEFGAINIKEHGEGELKVQCVMPYHNDTSASADLNYKKLTYNCFSCGSSGGLLWFIAMCRGVSSKEAREWLGTETGIGIEVQDLDALLRYLDALYEPSHIENVPIPRMSTAVLKPWRLIHPYMTEQRGVPEDTIVHFNVGYDPAYRIAETLESERIIIPVFWDGDLVGWQTRRLYKDGTPKYFNSPDFPRDRIIYNYDKSQRSVVIVESPMSVLRHWHSTPWLMATFGSEVTPRQLRHLSRFQNITIFFDNDDAGWDQTPLIADALAPYADVRIVNNPYDADPADLDTDTYLGLLDEAVPYSLWTWPSTLIHWEVPAA